MSEHDHPQHHHGQHGHQHAHGEIDEIDWTAMAVDIELQGEVLMPILDQAVVAIADESTRRGLDVQRIIDIGSGPGVASTRLAQAFVGAEVTAVDGSPAMTERADARIERLGLSQRVRTATADLPAGLDGLGPAQIVWAAMVMHHLGDERSVLRAIRSTLVPGGLVALLEFGDPQRFLPEGVEAGPPGLLDRVDAILADWVTSMRAAFPDATVSDDYPSMLAATGFEVVVDRLLATLLDPPLGVPERKVILNHLTRMRDLAAPKLDAADVAALDLLLDPTAPEGILQREDIVLEASRHLYLARAVSDDDGFPRHGGTRQR